MKTANSEWCVFRTNVTDRFGSVIAEFGNVTGQFGDATTGSCTRLSSVAELSRGEEVVLALRMNHRWGITSRPFGQRCRIESFPSRKPCNKALPLMKNSRPRQSVAFA